MPFQYVLANLLSEDADTIGVLFLDGSGETIDLVCAEYSPFEMKVAGAYLGIYLRRIAQIVESSSLGSTREFHIERERLHFHVTALPDGYFLALVQRSPAVVARARERLQHAAAELKRVVFES
jgi:hypothetical protein